MDERNRKNSQSNELHKKNQRPRPASPKQNSVERNEKQPRREPIERRRPPVSDRVKPPQRPVARTECVQKERRAMSKKSSSESFIESIKERMTPRLTIILSVSAVFAVLFICMLINIFIGFCRCSSHSFSLQTPGLTTYFPLFPQNLADLSLPDGFRHPAPPCR